MLERGSKQVCSRVPNGISFCFASASTDVIQSACTSTIDVSMFLCIDPTFPPSSPSCFILFIFKRKEEKEEEKNNTREAILVNVQHDWVLCLNPTMCVHMYIKRWIDQTEQMSVRGTNAIACQAPTIQEGNLKRRENEKNTFTRGKKISVFTTVSSTYRCVE